jgi:hypothetical protein
MLSNVLAPITGKGHNFGDPAARARGQQSASLIASAMMPLHDPNVGMMPTKKTGSSEPMMDEEESQKLLNKGKKHNLLALDKWSTENLLVVQQHYRLVVPDGVLIDKGAIIVTGRPVPGQHSDTHFETLHEAIMHCVSSSH